MTTTVVLIRHESRGANEEVVPVNCLTLAARQRAFRSGQRLAELGYHITAAYSSPQWRALETLQQNLAGNRGDKGPIPLTGVDAAFGDMLLGAYPYTEEEKKSIMAAAKTAGIPAEEYLVTAPEHAAKAAARGTEGGDSLWAIVMCNPGKTIAIASHGGSRIEPMIEALSPRPEGAAIHMVPPGGTVILRFNSDRLECTGVQYLGNLGISAE